MKKRYFFLLAGIAITLSPLSHVFAQTVLGPYDKYVSAQAGNDLKIASGSYAAFADEGRVINVQIINVLGPIQVSPASYQLNGPPCPTYDSHGHRNPTTPVPPNSAMFSGNVSVDPSNIPAPGTMVPAQFTGKEMGYYTHCASGEQVPMDSQRTVKFNIKSIQLVLGNKDLTVCMGEDCKVKISKLFPNNTGTVTWASVKGNFTVTGDNNGATLKGSALGDDQLVATFTVGNATFKDTAKVNVGTVAFKDKEVIKPFYPGGTLDCNTLLTDASTRKNLRWRITTKGMAGTIDSMTGIFTYPKAAGGIYPIEVKIKDSKVCVATVKLIMLGFSVVLKTKKTYCDGEEAPVKIVPVPNTVKPAELAVFGNIELYSETKNTFVGNPVNKKVLEFDPLDANFNSKVKNCYWYSSEIKGFCNFAGCNPSCIHKLKAKAKVNGKDVFSSQDPELTVSIANPLCINGFTSATQTFTGAPAFGPGVIVFQGRRIPVVVVTGVGTLTRAPKGKVTTLKCNANSQFRKYIVDEEDYHVGQIEGKNGNLCNNLWLVANVMANLRALQLQGFPNLAVANQAALIAINAENQRCNNMLVYPAPKRCAIEKEAKTATGIKFGYNFKCAYCQCPQN